MSEVYSFLTSVPSLLRHLKFQEEKKQKKTHIRLLFIKFTRHQDQ